MRFLWKAKPLECGSLLPPSQRSIYLASCGHQRLKGGSKEAVSKLKMDHASGHDPTTFLAGNAGVPPVMSFI
jgi:hypothetical protein